MCRAEFPLQCDPWDRWSWLLDWDREKFRRIFAHWMHGMRVSPQQDGAKLRPWKSLGICPSWTSLSVHRNCVHSSLTLLWGEADWI